jgi:hypothetical protein
MNKVDISEMGDLLNMRNVFTMYFVRQLKTPHSAARKMLSEFRLKLNSVIEHLSYYDLNAMMLELIKKQTKYSVLTRTTLKQSLKRANPFQLLTTVALFEDLGTEQALLYLLSPQNYEYQKGKELLTRFGFIQLINKK